MLLTFIILFLLPTIFAQVFPTSPISYGIGFNGFNTSAYAGTSVSSAGDFNNDGYEDFLVGSPSFSSSPSRVFLFFGRPDIAPYFNFSNLATNNSNGILFETSNTISFARKNAVVGVGDVNNDGFDDILFGAYQADPNGQNDAGEAYLIYGSDSLLSPFNISSQINGTNGVTFFGWGAPSQYCGKSVSAAGNVNNDSFSDFLIGCPSKSPSSGEAFLIYGSAAPLSHPFNLSASSFNGINGVSFSGVSAGDLLGTSLSPAGDFDGDGIDDFLIGAPSAFGESIQSGAVYLIYGVPNQGIPNPFDLSVDNTSASIHFYGVSANYLQQDVVLAPAGDLNNDTFDDIFITTPKDGSQGIVDAGLCYIVYGTSNHLHFIIEPEGINFTLTDGIKIYGHENLDRFGDSVASGDFNGDGIPDILVGANKAEPDNLVQQGAAYLIYGSQNMPFENFISNLSVSTGIRFAGTLPWQNVGSSVANVGDINQDGISDILIGAKWYNSPFGDVRAGRAMLYLGSQEGAGYFRNIDTLQLDPCPPGSTSFTSINSDPNCFPCPTGTFSLSSGSLCDPCLPGSWSNLTGQTECFLCTPGFYSSQTGESEDPCRGCPASTYTHFPGSISCLDCPLHSICDEGTSDPVPESGYILVPGSYNQFVSCIPPEACPGGKLNTCSKGYDNPKQFCSECSLGYYRSRGKCESCPGTSDNSSLIITGFVLLYFTFLTLLIPISAQGHKFGATSMYASLFQIISLFGYIHLPDAPVLWNFTFDVMTTALFSFEIASPECTQSSSVGSNSFLTTWYLQVFSPIISIAYYLFLYSIIALYQRFCGNLNTLPALMQRLLNIPKKQLAAFIRGATVFSFTLLYPISTKSSISMLDCIQFSPNGDFFVYSHPFFTCYTPEWNFVAAIASIFLICFTFGFPMFIIFYLYRQRRDGFDFSETKKLVYGSLIDKYKPQFSYWEAIALIRKTILLVAAILLKSDFQSVFAVFGIVLAGSIVIQAGQNPFWTEWLNRFEMLRLFSSVTILLLANYIYISTDQTSLLAISIINIIVIVTSILIGVYFTRKHRLIFIAFKNKNENQEAADSSLELPQL